MSARICKRSITFTGKPALKKKLKTPGCLLACCVENCIKDSDSHSKWIVFSCEWCPPPLLFGLKLVVSTCLFFFGWGTEHSTFEGNTWPGRVGQVLARCCHFFLSWTKLCHEAFPCTASEIKSPSSWWCSWLGHITSWKISPFVLASLPSTYQKDHIVPVVVKTEFFSC